MCHKKGYLQSSGCPFYCMAMGLYIYFRIPKGVRIFRFLHINDCLDKKTLCDILITEENAYMHDAYEICYSFGIKNEWRVI